ncbi:hypothetical protein DZF91_23995 [Actinomadura logoneensis]|uniref:Chromosome segregation ATPase n=1 Tax=Actinomadura logoneensis TaxID=2293572 RepID=A0A372JGM3_9ACTN|nr:hypothetical protein DZF91_23995 [Actinomadura logoneensis]
MAARLAGALAGELTVAGVEARIAQVRADTAAVEAEAHRAVEAARSQAREALAVADAQRHRADRAEDLTAELRERLTATTAEHDRLRERFDQLTRTAEQAGTALEATRRDQARLADQVSELTGSLQSAIEEISRLRGDLGAAQAAEKAAREQAMLMATEMRQQHARLEEAAAGRARALQDADDARAQARAEHIARVKVEQQARIVQEQIGDALQQRDRALESTRSAHERLDLTRKAASEQQAEAARQARLVTELQARVEMLVGERDAARAEADRARHRVDQFITTRHQGPGQTGAGTNQAGQVGQTGPLGPVAPLDHRGTGRPADPQTSQPGGTVSYLHRVPRTGSG